MSALTDLFTAMANKIRSKTGTATTYTPLQMVSDGIDDVYAAGYDAGGGGATGIPITPSNASPVNLTTGDSYQMLADGYAISSYTNLTPSNSSPVSLTNNTIYKTGGAGVAIASYSSVTPSNTSPASLSSGSIYKMGGNGYAYKNQPTTIMPNNNGGATLSLGGIYRVESTGGYAVQTLDHITPSDSSPVALTSGNIYRPGSAGYAIASNPLSITPSSSGVYFSSGIKKMTAAGYAYNYQPGAKTTLWTNSSPTSNFGTQNVTVSNMSSYDYIGIEYEKTKSNTTLINLLFPYSDFTKTISSNDSGRCRYDLYYYSTTRYVRYSSDTQVYFSDATSGGTTYNQYCIPTKIYGIKM